MRIAVTAAAVLALAATASAKTIAVPKDQPTVQAGVTAAVTGDTVSIAKGVYYENVTVSTPGIKIVGKGAILDGTVGGVDLDCLVVNAADVVVQGVTFRNGGNHIILAASGLQVLKCTFYDPGTDCINGTGSNVVVTSSKFYGMSSEGIELYGNTNTVAKCTFSRSGNRGVYLEGDGNRVESCTFTGMDDSNGAYVVGNNAFVSKNRAAHTDSDAFRVDGDGAVVELNKGDRCDSRLVLVNGNSATVNKNTGTYCQGGVEVSGDGATILSNKFTNIGSTDGIFVDGDGFTVTGNTVAVTWDDADGISANSSTGTGGGLIEGNKVSDSAGYGFNLNSINNVTVRSNSATRCGQDGRGGFAVVGDGNTLDSLKATDVEGPGFLVDGASNTATACSVKKAYTDGFRVAAGSTGSSFDRCSASSCGGEGFDNRGSNTAIANSTFSKNRIDVANDVLGGATIPGGLATVKFTTGGATTQPEVD